MSDRGLGRAVRLVPRSGTEVEIRDQIGLHPQQFGLKQLAEQVVIAVLLTAPIQGNHQQIPALHPFEKLSGSLPLQDGVA